MSGVIKFKPTDRDAWQALFRTYLSALPAFYTAIFCKEFLALHTVLGNIAHPDLDALEEAYFKEEDEGTNTIRYLRIIPLQKRDEILAAWEALWQVMDKDSHASTRVKRLRAEILGLSSCDIVG